MRQQMKIYIMGINLSVNRYYTNEQKASDSQFFTLIKRYDSKYYILEKNKIIKDINGKIFYNSDLDCFSIISYIIKQKYRNKNMIMNGETFPEIHQKIKNSQNRQPHSPVDREDVDFDDHRHQKICRELRHDVGQRRLDAVDPFHQRILQGAAALTEDGAQRHAGQLFHAPLADPAEHGEGRPVAGRGGECMEQNTAQPQNSHDEAPAQIKAELTLSIHQPLYDPHDNKVRRHRKCHADDRENHTENILPSVIPRLPQHPSHGRLRFPVLIHTSYLHFCTRFDATNPQ